MLFGSRFCPEVYAIIAPQAEPQWGGAPCAVLGPREEYKLCTLGHMC